MLRLRLLLLLAVCVVTASAARADDLGYVDCASHPDPSQVYTKPRQSQDVVGSVACGERFIVLVNGFIFSRIQTADGKIGFVLSSIISVDHNSTSLTQANAGRPKAPAASAPAATAASAAPTQPQPVAAAAVATPQPVVAQAAPAPLTSTSVPAASANIQADASNAPVQPVAAPKQSEPAPAQAAPPSASPATASADVQPAPTAASSALPTPPPPADAQPAAAQPQSTPSMLTPPPSAAVPAQPAPAAASQPEPAPAAPEVEPSREPSARSTWEKPVPGAHRTTLVEFFGGFSFARFDNGGGYSNGSNMLGGLGSFGINLTNWLQVTGDTSYNFVTVSGTKNILYGNHFGPRVYYRKHNRWGITPFGEALVGGSRLDSTTAGITTSANCISYKFGGGIDMRAGRHWEFRVLDVDYYRTAFGTGLHQSNYSASVGVVLRLFGGTGE